MKTPEAIANEFMEVDDEWRPSESQWVALKAIISKIQQDAFESGRVRGIEDCMGEFIGGSKEWIVLRSRLSRSTATKSDVEVQK